MSTIARLSLVAGIATVLALGGGIAASSAGIPPSTLQFADQATTPTAGVRAPDTPGTPGPSPVPIPTAAAVVTPGPDGTTDYCATQTTLFTGEPASQFGADQVMAAYCSMVQLTLDQSTWQTQLLATGPRHASDFTSITDTMTPAMLQAWTNDVAHAIQGDQDAAQQVRELMFYNLVPAADTVGTTPVARKRFSPGRATVTRLPDGASALIMTITVAADIHTIHAGKATTTTTGKTVSYTLVPEGGRWLIADVQAAVSVAGLDG